MMDPVTRTRTKWIGALTVYMIVAYFLIGRFNLDRSYYVDVALPFEDDIPFVPEAIFAYAFVYLLLAVGILSLPQDDLPYYERTARWLRDNLTVAFVIFLLVPVKAMHRPIIDPEVSFSMAVTGFYYAFDAPTNLLPSLHVQMGTLGGLLCLKRGGLLAVFGVVCAALVAVSVLLVKQHYVADIALAMVILWVTARWHGMGSFLPGR